MPCSQILQGCNLQKTITTQQIMIYMQLHVLRFVFIRCNILLNHRLTAAPAKFLQQRHRIN
jgi:hypothetical protein